MHLFPSFEYPSGTRTTVCLGTPRGGTSMVAGAISGLGVFMGSDLPVNVEDRAFNPDQHQGDLDGFLDTLPPVIKDRNETYAHWGWKYPRAERYLERVADQLKGLHLIVVLRDPVPACLRTLKRSDADPMQVVKRRIQMEARNIALVDRLKRPTLLVSYERASTRPEVFLEELADFLGVEMPSDTSRILDFMTPGQYKPPVF